MPLLSLREPATVTEDVMFRAGANLLHGKLAYAETGCAPAAVVIAGPHPLLGGDMHNNVVRRLGDGLAENGFITLRFDYRGVGRSEGPPVDVARHLAEFWQTSHALGEMDFWQDVHGAVEFVQQETPGVPLILIGYSFGCALLPFARPQEDPIAFVLIAPTLTKHDYESFQEITRPLLVIASEDDFAGDTNQLEQWFGKLAMPRQMIRQRCDNHFFRGHEDWLVETVSQYVMPAGGDDE